jgi:hypothetical protein
MVTVGSSHRKFTHAAVGIAMAAATFRFMQATAKTAMRRVRLLGIRGGQGETLVPPTAVAGGDEGLYLNSRHPKTTTAANYAVLW